MSIVPVLGYARQPLALFVRRGLAGTIDIVAVCALFLPLMFLVVACQWNRHENFWLSIAPICLPAAYSLPELGLWGSMGKRLMHLALAGHRQEAVTTAMLWIRWGTKWGPMLAAIIAIMLPLGFVNIWRAVLDVCNLLGVKYFPVLDLTVVLAGAWMVADFVIALFPSHRSLHDRLAGTAVVERQ